MTFSVRFLRGVQICLSAIFFTVLLTSSGLRVSTEPGQAIRRYTRPLEFDYVDWTLEALGIKLVQASLDTPSHFDASARHRVVMDFLRLLDDILQDEYQLSLIYTDPAVRDPAATSADLRLELAGKYARQRKIGPLAEAVLEQQVASILADLQLTTGGQPLPPVSFHISPLPFNLVVSPRNRIQQKAAVSLVPDLSVDQHASLEERIDAGLDVSSLVVPIGGLGSYPTMIMRVTALDWLTDTIAHEWLHNWLSLRPLGFNYATTPELRTMNETTASIAGGEIAQLVLRRYYPTLAAAYAHQTASLTGAPVPAPALDFDFRLEMHTTRLRVDELLAAGQVEQAEAYMEQRRQVFWENGYAIRKLNQAYFAFYGAYADVPGGPAGEDPVGPAVRALRAQSPNLTIFLKTIARMSSFEQLQAALEK